MNNSANTTIHYRQYRTGQWNSSEGKMITEAPVSLTVNGEEWLVFMCTPVDLEALAAGFLFNEGLIQAASELASIHVCSSGEIVDVWLTHAVKKPARWLRTSGCTGGVTSADTLADFDETSLQPVLPQAFFTPQQITALMAQLLEAQNLYQQTGGVHTSALSDGERIILTAEDIGRHNTLDKIAGRCLIENKSVQPRLLLTTGRISSEMLQKAVRLGVVVVISRTAPTSLSVRLAEKAGITLIGYARRERFNVYSHPERIKDPVTKI